MEVLDALEFIFSLQKQTIEISFSSNFVFNKKNLKALFELMTAQTEKQPPEVFC